MAGLFYLFLYGDGAISESGDLLENSLIPPNNAMLEWARGYVGRVELRGLIIINSVGQNPTQIPTAGFVIVAVHIAGLLYYMKCVCKCVVYFFPNMIFSYEKSQT